MLCGLLSLVTELPAAQAIPPCGAQHLAVPRANQVVTWDELDTAREALAIPAVVAAVARGIATKASKAAAKARRSPSVADVRRAVGPSVGKYVKVVVRPVRNGVRVSAVNPYTKIVSRVSVTVEKRRTMVMYEL